MPRQQDTTNEGKDPMGDIGKSLKKTFTPVKAPVFAAENEEDLARAACIMEGGKWDSVNKVCIRPGQETFPKEETPEDAGLPKVDQTVKKNPDGSFTVTDAAGNTSTMTSAQYERAKNIKGLETMKGGATVSLFSNRKQGGEIGNYLNMQNRAQVAQAQLTAQNQALAGQVGQFEQLGVSPTGMDLGEAGTAGLVNAIPRALGFAATGAVTGAIGGTMITPGAGTAIGAVAGFTTGISTGILSNMKKQRTDTTTAQLNTLMEGKKNLNKWATLAATDPYNRAFYVSEFNAQLALIDQAYRQMKLDTSRDVLKFEDGVTQLAEFEEFYSASGARNILSQQMIIALQAQQDPEYVYRMQMMLQENNNI